MNFSMKARLGLRHESEREPVLSLNELRNAAAHQFGALDTAKFSGIVARFGFPWPQGVLERAAILELIVWHVMQIVMRWYLEELYWGENVLMGKDAEHHKFVEDWADQLRSIVLGTQELAQAGNFDALVEMMKPGWRVP